MTPTEYLLSAMAARSRELVSHSRRVSTLAARLGERLGLTSTDVEHLRVGGLLHDAGKLVIPDDILFKPGPLTMAERFTIQQHATHGYWLLVRAFPREVAEIAHSHHERWDGTGYPRRLKGEATPLLARLVAVADVFESLISTTAWRPAHDRSSALRFIEEESGRQFDPEMAQALLGLAGAPARRLVPTGNNLSVLAVNSLP